MSATLSNIVLSAALRAKLTDSIEGVAPVVDAGQGIALSLADGTSADQADQLFQDEGIAISSGNNVDLDLYDLANFGLQTDPLRNSITFAEIVGILITNDSDSAGDLIVGGNGTAAAWTDWLQTNSDTLRIAPGGFECAGNPANPAFAITDSSNHLLRLAASGGDVTGNVYLLGRSA